jgi:gas vesicle protein
MLTINQEMMGDLGIGDYDADTIKSLATESLANIKGLIRHKRIIGDKLAKLKELDNIKENLKSSNRIDRDLAGYIDEETNGKLRSRIMLEEFTILPTKTNLAFSINFIRDELGSTIEEIKEQVSTLIERAKEEMSRMEDEVEDDMTSIEDLYEINKTYSAILDRVFESFVLFDTSDNEVNLLTTDIMDVSLPMLDGIKSIMRVVREEYGYAGLYTELRNRNNIAFDTPITMEVLIKLFDTVIPDSILSYGNSVERAVANAEAFKTSLDSINELDKLKEFVVTNALGVVEEVVACFNTKFFIDDLLVMRPILVQLIMESDALK